MAALRQHRARQAQERLLAGTAWTETDLVFTTELGTPLDPRNAVRSLRSAWRWAAVMALVISLVVIRRLIQVARDLPPPDAWGIAIAFATDAAVGVFLPWVLLTGVIRPRVLVPGALLYALVMVPVRTASRLWLPEMLEATASRYGTIGVAFNFIAWLYVVSFCLLSANVIGNVLATDESAFGRWIRGSRPDDDPAGS